MTTTTLRTVPVGTSTQTDDVAVTVEGLHKAYRDVVAVDEVSFDVCRGEILGLLGPNGSGKTTTVECIQGLRRADAGHVEVLGLDPRSDIRQLRGLLGSQLQDSALPDRLKVWEALRLFVVLALVNDPHLVILDEMTTGLDPAARRVAWGSVQAVRDRGTTVILVTHAMEEAARLCDRLVVIRAGRVVATGNPAELVDHATTTNTITFTVDPSTDLAFLHAVDGVTRVQADRGHVTVTGHGSLLALTAHALVDHGLIPSDLAASTPTLEDAYLDLATCDVETVKEGRHASAG